MEAFFNAIKSLKRWQIVVLLLIILGSASATYGVYTEVSASGQTGLAEDQQLIPVRSGSLVNQVSTSGNLVFPERENLTFGSPGTVAEVLVKPGQQVAKGQALARLDTASIAAAAEAVAQAKLDLQNAEAALTALELEHALQLAQAEESVANAEFQLQEAQKALEDARQPYAQEEAVASARLALRDAQKALANLEPDYALRLAQAQQAKADAEAALEDAREGLENLEGDYALQLATAVQAKADAEMALKQAQEALADYEAANGQRLGDLRPDKAAAEANLEAAQNELDRLVLAQESASGDLTPFIRQWEEFVELRKEALASLQAELAEVEQLESQVELAQEEQEKAQKDLKRLEAGLDPLELALQEAQVASAQATLTQAEEDLAEILKGADSIQVTLREKQVAVAEATLAQARNDLAKLQNGPDPLEAALREARVASAQQALEDAVQRLEDSTLKAPIDGLVSLVNVEEGDKVEATTVAVEVVDPTVVEIDGVVDEIDVLSVKEGIPVQVTLDALPGQVLEGMVTEVAPAAQNQQGVVTYPVKVQVEVPEGVQVREGLTAVANIVLSEERNVLLVPEQALRGSFNQPTVQVMTSRGVETKPVVLGNTDGFWVAVHQGLEEGEQVVMEAVQVNTDQFSFRQFRAVPGGAGLSRRGG